MCSFQLCFHRINPPTAPQKKQQQRLIAPVSRYSLLLVWVKEMECLLFDWVYGKMNIMFF